MSVFRKVVDVGDNILRIELPEEYRHRRVEVIVLPVEEETLSHVEEPRPLYGNFYGSLKLGLTADEIDQKIKSFRDEWDTDFS